MVMVSPITNIFRNKLLPDGNIFSLNAVERSATWTLDLRKFFDLAQNKFNNFPRNVRQLGGHNAEQNHMDGA